MDHKLHSFGLGLIIRNAKGQVMAFATLHREGSPTMAEAEAHAILEGMRFAIESGFFDHLVESDSLSVIQLIKSANLDVVFSGVGILVSDIVDCAGLFNVIDFEFAHTKVNGPAHHLARHGISSSIDLFWMEEVPPFIHLD